MKPAGRAPFTPPQPDPQRFGLLDPLSEVLEGVRLRCMVPSAHEMTAPWGIHFGAVSRAVMREHAASLGLPLPPRDPPPPRGAIIAVIRGSCWLEIGDQRQQLALGSGDIVLLNRRSPFTLRDDPRTPAKDVLELVQRDHVEQRRGLTHGGGGAATTFLCGHYFFQDEEDNPLLNALPPVSHVGPSTADAVPHLDATLRFLAHELSARRPGCQSVVNHLAHVLFVQAVRAYAATLPEDGTANWFRAMTHPDVAPVIGLIHRRPEEPWTVERLAEEVHASRSTFAAKFTAVVGCPPLQYLTECRMRNAKALLRETQLGMKAIARKVGYSNEAAFSNAFKRVTGTSPGGYRKASARDRLGDLR